MRLLFLSLQLLGILALRVDSKTNKVRWCVWKSEHSRCRQLQLMVKKDGDNSLSCVKKETPDDCFKAIEGKKADFTFLIGKLIYEAMQKKHDLRPIVSEVYGSVDDPRKHYYAVALAKKNSKFQMNQLQGVKSCHTAHKGYSGWIAPMSYLSQSLKWKSTEPIEESASKYFSASCLPCANKAKHPNLCKLCAGADTKNCACSKKEPHFGFSGAFKCLKEDHGQVAFVRDSTIFDELKSQTDRNEYELLCPDNTRKSVDKFKSCNLGQSSSFAMVGRSKDNKEDLIWNLLSKGQEKQHGSGQSEFFGLKDSWKGVLFSKAAIGFSKIPANTDLSSYLGPNYPSAYQNLTQSQ